MGGGGGGGRGILLYDQTYCMPCWKIIKIPHPSVNWVGLIIGSFNTACTLLCQLQNPQYHFTYLFTDWSRTT